MSSSPTPTSTASSTRPPAAASPLPNPLAACPTTQHFAALRTLAHLTAADDVAAALDGSLWLSDASSLLEHVSTAGNVLERIDDLRAPEGIVALADGTLIVAEQGTDRILRIDPSTHVETMLLQVTPRSGALGVDGLGYDAIGNAVLVPDSPNGTLLELSLSTGTLRQIASGLGRPVSAALVASGVWAVAAEDTPGLFIVARAHGSAPIPFGSAAQGDDVVASGGVLYVTSLSTGQVLAVDAATAQSVVLVDGVPMPQGIAMLPAGGLALTDSASGRVAAVQTC